MELKNIDINFTAIGVGIGVIIVIMAGVFNSSYYIILATLIVTIFYLLDIAIIYSQYKCS